MSHNLDTDKHKDFRAVLKVVGPVVLGVGVLFSIVGFASFFSAFGSGGMPNYFWCLFVGFPLMGLGGTITKFAFLGTVTRYMANEVAPVGKDVVNYMADGTQDAVRDISSAIGEGFASSLGQQTEQEISCQKCNESNDSNANFCNHCGAAISKPPTCPNCNQPNDPDASYCDNCGQKVT